MKGKITSISGPLVVASNMQGARLYDLVEVGNEKLLGEIIELRKDKAWIQVYEDTAGITTSEPVSTRRIPLSVTLGPGMLGKFYDGIQRPLSQIYDKSGNFIKRGIFVDSIDMKKSWDFKPSKKKGDQVIAGDIIGEVKENKLVNHKILVPFGISGTIKSIKKGSATNADTIAEIQTDKGVKKMNMYSTWPIRTPRGYKNKIASSEPLLTGQRVIDTFFPLAKGGAASVPGPFGSGKTVVQQQLAKWADADIIVYVGCGERGNEMTEVLHEFSHLKDPKSGEPLMDRTILIANTSNMPIAAREASIYTGITIAEYFRDMGYDVALMADSTSRWAEALREISARLEEMPGEEGYPAYLNSRIAEFYERAGKVESYGSDKKIGSISVIGAVSPPGGDLSEPVSQSTLNVTKVFWALDGSLAKARHYPAIHWLNSYSLYSDAVDKYIKKNIYNDFPEKRKKTMEIFQKESELEEIIRIVGTDSLSNKDRLLLMVSRSLREDFLQQNAYDDEDTYTPFEKQIAMLRFVLEYLDLANIYLEENEEVNMSHLLENSVTEMFPKIKYMKKEDIEKMTDDINIEKLIATSKATQEKDPEVITNRKETATI